MNETDFVTLQGKNKKDAFDNGVVDGLIEPGSNYEDYLFEYIPNTEKNDVTKPYFPPLAGLTEEENMRLPHKYTKWLASKRKR